MENLNEVLKEVMASTTEIQQEMSEMEKEELNRMVEDFINEKPKVQEG